MIVLARNVNDLYNNTNNIISSSSSSFENRRFDSTPLNNSEIEVEISSIEAAPLRNAVLNQQTSIQK